MENQELHSIIQACKEGDSKGQEKLFHAFYNYGMSIASRYGSDLAESEDIANEGFYKMLSGIDKYKKDVPFKLWLRRIIINCGIDHYRKQNHEKQRDHHLIEKQFATNKGETKMDSDYLLEMIRLLTPQYKMVFVMFAVEGFSHQEIAEKLNITVGTSKSNLSKARKKLQEMIQIHNQQKANYGAQ